MTREEIISAWEFVEDGLPFDALESKDNRVDMHELIHSTIEVLSADHCEGVISRQVVKEQMINYGFHAPDMTVTEFVEDILPVTPNQRPGHWIESNDIDFYRCSECGCHWEKGMVENCNMDFCPNCGARMEGSVE